MAKKSDSVTEAPAKPVRGKRATFARTYGEFLRRHSLGELDLDPRYFDSLRDRPPGRKVRF